MAFNYVNFLTGYFFKNILSMSTICQCLGLSPDALFFEGRSESAITFNSPWHIIATETRQHLAQK